MNKNLFHIYNTTRLIHYYKNGQNKATRYGKTEVLHLPKSENKQLPNLYKPLCKRRFKCEIKKNTILISSKTQNLFSKPRLLYLCNFCVVLLLFIF